ncbi:MAG: NnrS [Gallionellales bacterium GWA2_60_142]|nr:MAG: NnrS [Gallionellales bacterium GWA2_60_142]HCI14851.1 NnrS family protein [Gallionellaceae bacterium]
MSHPFWQVGFRPFFALAMLSGLSLPALWALLFAGAVAAPETTFTTVQWHAHEMFFGFGWAVLGGFLLTATKNWVNVRGYHGQALMFLASAWLFERIGMWFEGSWPHALFLLSNNLFLGSIVAMLVWTLVKNRATDAYRDNYLFLLVLPTFLIAKQLMLSADYYLLGWSIALGLFRMAFLVMLERTLVQFMKGAFQVGILQHPLLDKAIKLLGLLLVFAGLLPPVLAAYAGLVLALLLAVRFAYWKPQLALTRLDIGIMYLGYLAIVAQLLVEFFRLAMTMPELVSLSIHVFTFGAMGLIVPAMLIRISQGHTGRKVVFDKIDKLALRIMMLAFVLRIVAPLFHPASYMLWIASAAVCWFAAFALLATRYIPLLLRPRVDGKPH